MKISDIPLDEIKNNYKLTVAYGIDNESKDKIYNFCVDIGVTPVQKSEMVIPILRTRKFIDIGTQGVLKNVFPITNGTLKTASVNGSQSLVIDFDCENLTERRKELRTEHQISVSDSIPPFRMVISEDFSTDYNLNLMRIRFDSYVNEILADEEFVMAEAKPNNQSE